MEVAREPGAVVEPRWRVLGRVGISVHGRELTLAPRSRFVLALLLRRPGEPVPVDALVPDGGEGTTEQAVASARVAVSRLRRTLEGVTSVSATAGGYVLDVDPQSVDHVRFHDTIREARSSEWPATAKYLVEKALAEWSAPPFGEWGAHPVLEPDVRALEELHRSAVDLWCGLVTQTGRHVEELDRLEREALDHPLREQRWEALMLAHYRSGNQSEAVRTYDRARFQLVEAVGLEPGTGLRTLLRRVLDQDPDLDWRPETRLARPSARTSLGSASVVIGRDGDAADVASMIERHRVVTLVGLGGIGKTALAGEVVRSTARSAWVVVLADVHDPEDIWPAIAHSLGLSNRIEVDALPSMVAEHLQAARGLLVLDNCEHLAEVLSGEVQRLVSEAPEARVLATSRVELGVTGGSSYRVLPLPLGTASEPGPGAFIVADHAAIGRSAMAERWEELAAVHQRAEGIPLALQLLGAAVSDPTLPDEPGDAVTDAVLGAVDALPAESRDLVRVLATLPASTSVEFLAEVLGAERSALRTALGFAVRSSLVVQHGGAGSARVRLIEPARDVLAGDVEPREVIDRLAVAVLGMATAARPTMIAPFDPTIGALLDDEHETVAWMLARVPPPERLVLATRLAPLWRAVGRTAYGVGVLTALEPVVEAADPVSAATYWIARAQIAPSVANRVPFIARLREAVVATVDAAVADVEIVARCELALGLGWSGHLDEARAHVGAVLGRIPEDHSWARNSVASLLAMGRALTGDHAGAAAGMTEAASGFRAGGDLDGAMWAASVASSYARQAGDLAAARAALRSVDDLVPDRFMRFSHATLSYERAMIAVAEGAADAGPRLWDALGLLTEHADERAIAACRTDLGIWRLDHADPGGIGDLARGVHSLLRAEPARASRGLERLAREWQHRRPADAELLLARAASPGDDALAGRVDRLLVSLF